MPPPKCLSWMFISLFFLLLIAMISGCSTLKDSRPILPIKEYEKMIVGRFDADYVGTANCLAACHEHDRLRQDFDASTMGAQLKKESGLPLVDCESCHGPGSLAIKGLTRELVEENTKKGIKTKCDFETLIDMKNLPAPAQSLTCLKCHTANATFNLHNWNASTHATNEVSCFDCHQVHGSPDLKVSPINTGQMCFRCHLAPRAEFSMPSHHPLNEKRIFCIDCHDTHGGIGDRHLRKETIKETCVQCHPEKRGPFVYEHADVLEDCLNCHVPHGSVNDNLLVAREPFLCLQCHEGHRINTPGGGSTSAASRRAFYSRCTDCHSRIHGSDVPSASGKGRFTQ
ncbi:MAG: cytochrome C [Deltaproteobacteria bacterium RIFOXYD12_FULL_57_12]|nr:MAG: cytochrome C [Deltaproteobacteria bacterium RIFOXYD12_FULL_57_12]